MSMIGKKRIINNYNNQVVKLSCLTAHYAKLEAVPKASCAVDFEHPLMQALCKRWLQLATKQTYYTKVDTDGYVNVNPTQKKSKEATGCSLLYENKISAY